MDLFIIRLKQRVSITYLNFHLLSLPLSEDSQNEILNTLVDISHTNKHYSMCILKKLIDIFENEKDMEINESYYEYLMEWLQSKPLKPTDTDIITYTFDNRSEIKIRESPNLISGLGTTGLRTWEASLYLSNYLMDKQLDGDIVELGCGTGIVSISILKNSLFKSRLYITDGDSQLVERVKDNIEMNGVTRTDNYEIRKLWWGEDYLPDNVRTLVAADVTYDSGIIPELIQVINEGMSQGSVQTAIIAATKRNEDTLKVWEQWLDMGKQDGIWTWTIEVSTSISPIDYSDSPIFYGGFPNDIFVYRIEKFV